MTVFNFPDTSGKPTDGTFTWTAPNGLLYSWDGDAWRTIGGGGDGNASITITDDLTTIPAPDAGDLAWHTIEARMYIYYQDDDSQQWVDASPAGDGGGEIYWDIDTIAGTITMTWVAVAPFSGTGTNSFQVVLTDNGSGDFTAEYIYEEINWTGDGFGDVADVGLTDGGANGALFDGSGDAAELINYDTNDFLGGDPAGTLAIDFSGGTPLILDGIVEGTVRRELVYRGRSRSGI